MTEVSLVSELRRHKTQGPALKIQFRKKKYPKHQQQHSKERTPQLVQASMTVVTMRWCCVLPKHKKYKEKEILSVLYRDVVVSGGLQILDLARNTPTRTQIVIDNHKSINWVSRKTEKNNIKETKFLKIKSTIIWKIYWTASTTDLREQKNQWNWSNKDFMTKDTGRKTDCPRLPLRQHPHRNS